jgi:hypothetical protein
MTLRMGGGYRHHARSFRGWEVFGCTGERGSDYRDQAVTQSRSHAVTQSRSHAVTQSRSHAVKQSSSQAVKQSSKKAFLSQRNKGEQSSARRSKDFSASRKNLTKLRAKRNHPPTLWPATPPFIARSEATRQAPARRASEGAITTRVLPGTRDDSSIWTGPPLHSIASLLRCRTPRWTRPTASASWRVVVGAFSRSRPLQVPNANALQD